MKKVFLLTAGLAMASWAAALSFTEQPTIQFNSGTGKWDIRFGVSDSTDVEVTVVDAADSSVVRRLTAGRLGANPPAPLQSNSLVQAIEWDGRDELGDTVESSARLLLRVRAGMHAVLERTIGASTYYFEWISGAAFDAEGRLCVWGAANGMARRDRTAAMTLRRFDVDGSYLKTLFPLPADMDTSLVTPWNAYKKPNTSKFIPTYFAWWVPWLSFNGSILNMNNKVTSNHFMMPLMVDDKVMVYNADSFCLVGMNSTMERGKATRLLPLQSNQGPFFSQAPDGGICYGMGRTLYRFNPLTGMPAVWHAFASTDSLGTPMGGFEFDGLGRVFVCDPSNSRVWVIDTLSWSIAGSIPVTNPHQVTLNPETGEVYVLSRNMLVSGPTDPCVLRCFTGWSAPSLKDSLAGSAITAAATGAPVQIRLTVRSPKPVIGIAGNGNIQFLEDQGTGFTVIRDFNLLSAGEHSARLPNTFERIAVDRNRETVYFTTGYAELYKVSDWAANRVVQCSTASHAPLWAGDAAISRDGFLYVRQAASAGAYSGPVTKWTTDYYHAPSSYGSSASNVADPDVYGRFGAANGEKGIAVSRDNKVADIPIVADTWARYILRVIDPADPSGSRARQTTLGIVEPLADHGAWMDASMDCPFNVGSMKFDYDGNIYVGSSLTAPGHVLPQRYPMVPPTNYVNTTVGAVYKFPPTGGGLHRTSATGTLRAYKQGLSIFSGGSSQWGVGCACRTPRFDVDPWGRLIIPNALLCEVAVVDNNGNNIVKFGEYGNADSYGPGSPIPGPVIPLATPQCAASSDDYIYVTDMNNLRLARVQMCSELDNMPDLSPAPIRAEAAAGNACAPGLVCWPNPFNPESRVRFSLPVREKVRLEVYDAAGRLVRTLAEGTLRAGAHEFSWNGRDGEGRQAAAGLYVYRFAAGGKVMSVKTVFSR